MTVSGIDKKAVENYLSKKYNINVPFTMSKTKSNGVNIVFISRKCLVCPDDNHSNINTQVSLYINKKKLVASCTDPDHDKEKKLFKKDNIELFRICGFEKKKIPPANPLKDATSKEIKDINDRYDLRRIFRFLLMSCSTTHCDVAQVLHVMFGKIFILIKESPYQVWYKYENGSWVQCEGTSFIRAFISKDLAFVYYCFRIMCTAVLEDNRNLPEEFEFLEEYINIFSEVIDDEDVNNKRETCTEAICKFKTYGYQEALVKASQPLFKNAKFEDQLDTNPYLFSFGNIVYDLEKLEFRDSKPEDYMTMKCGIDINELKENDNYEDVLKILESIFPEPERLKYFIQSMSDLLAGINPHERFDIWTGNGGNGKGMIANLLEKVFGDYYCNISASVLTSKQKSQTADPELASIKGKRVIMASEPEQGSKINNSLIKRLSGNDTITTRQLYKDKIEFRVAGRVSLQANNVELQDQSDDSMLRRLCLIKFKSSFVDVEDIKFDFQKPIDKTLKNTDVKNKLAIQLTRLLIASWSRMTEEYKSVIHSYSTPKCITEDKLEFLDDNNSAKMFMKDKIEITNNNTDYIQLKELIEDYKIWCESENIEVGKPKRSELKKKFCKLLPEYKEKYQPGKRGEQKCIRSVFLNCKMKNDL